MNKKKYVKPNTNSEVHSFKNVINEHLRAEGDIQEKLENICDALQLTAEDLKKRKEVCSEIQTILKQFYPHCEVHIFGSSVNGYGFKGCDLDLLFLPYPKYCDLEIIAEVDKAIPKISDVVRGKVSTQQLCKLGGHSTLRFIEVILRQHLRKFRNIFFIPAKCPIVNFITCEYNIFCDLSCSNKLVLYNTYLLKLYAEIDSRVKPLIMILRYWAKSSGFVSKGSLTNYAFTLLVIFFLQNVNPPILPSKQQLSLLAKSKQLVSKWDCTFTEDASQIKPSKNMQVLEELLHGFFKFYRDFNFLENCLCPATGSVVSIRDITENAPDFGVSCMCVQDPFILSFNVCRNMRYPAFISFKKGLHIAANMRNGTFLGIDFQLAMKLENEEEEGFVCYLAATPDCFVTLRSNSCDMWYNVSTNVVMEILDDVLLMDCEIIDKGHSQPPCKKQAVLDSTHELLVSFQCQVYYKVWEKRHETTKALEIKDYGSTIEREKYISEKIAELYPSNSPLFCFHCHCYKFSKYSTADVKVIMKSTDDNKGFKYLANFLKTFLPKTVKKVLFETRRPSV